MQNVSSSSPGLIWRGGGGSTLACGGGRHADDFDEEWVSYN